ncbi:hypothetical protein TNCV_5017491 [Trichonephila clavipes]|nr:hypothetical protein TNCV_5017491 [Trichonephila clavipes]
MTAVNFLQQDNPPTWAGVEPATLGTQEPLDYIHLDINLGLHVKIKSEVSPEQLKTIALETIPNRFPTSEKLHVFTDGALIDRCAAGADVFCELFSFYLSLGNFKVEDSEMAKDKNWSILNKDPSCGPVAPRKATVAHFRLLTGHDCLKWHLYIIGIGNSPDCTLTDSGQPMISEHLVVWT